MSEHREPQNPRNRSAVTQGMLYGMTIGVAIGVALGTALHNMAFMGVDVAIGTALAVTWGSAMEERNEGEDE